jgi:hypothetical protein
LVEMLVAEENRLKQAPRALHRQLRSHIDFLRKELRALNSELDQQLRAMPCGTRRMSCSRVCRELGACCPPPCSLTCPSWVCSAAARSPSWLG